MDQLSVGDKVLIISRNKKGVIVNIYDLPNGNIALVKIPNGLVFKIPVSDLMVEKDVLQDEAENLADKLGDQMHDPDLMDEITISQSKFREISTDIIVSECSCVPHLSELVATIVAKIHVAIFERGDQSDETV